MSDFNPYAPPRQNAEPTYAGVDTADIFVDMLPTPHVRAAGIAAIITGIAMLFVTLQLVMGTRGPLAMLLETVLATIAVVHFLVAWGVSGGHAWLAVAGMGASFVSGLLLVLTFFLSGALSCVMAGTAALATLVLLGLNFGAVRKMGRARVAMARASARPT